MAEYPHILSKNLLQDADSTSLSFTEDSVHRVTHLTDRSRQSSWWGSGTGTHTITWNYSSAQEMDTFVLDKNFTLTGATIYFQHSADGVSFTNVVTISGLDSDDTYWRTFTAVSKQYWRLRITGLTAAPKIANLWAGKRIELTFGPYGEFDPWASEVVGDGATGTSGGHQYTRRYIRRVLRANFEHLNDTKYALMKQWRTEAGDLGYNFWWLAYPTTRAGDPTDSDYYPVYYNTQGGSVTFPFALGESTRHGSIEASEVL